MMIRLSTLAVLGLILLVVGGMSVTAQSNPGHYQQFGDAKGFMNIIPPGQDGVLNSAEALAAQGGQYPPHVRDQLAMYGDLVYNTPGLTEDRLREFFKDASFGVREDDIERVYSPTPGVIVVRDKSFGVPHIFGETRYATMFAQGYTGAEDRLFLMDVLRHVGRARLSEFLGASPSNQELDRSQLAIAPYTEADLKAQLEAGRSAGPEGEAIYADLLAYTDGVNAYINEALLDPSKLPAEYPALQRTPEPWKREDAAAIASLVGGIFGKGGGGELTNFCGLEAVATATGNPAAARAIFDDLHFANDPEAPTSSRDAAPYMTNLGPVNPAAHPDIKCDSLTPIDPDGPPLQDLLDAISEGFLPGLGFPGGMSNALLVSGQHTQNGRPIAIFGPQTAYFIPQLLVEKDVHCCTPGSTDTPIHARGVAFAGTDLWVQLGRGRNYAWSATSSGGDNVDQWVLRLCEPGPGGGTPTVNSMGYERNGVCEPIETFQHTQIAKPSAGGVPSECPPEFPPPCIVLSWRVERTRHYGPVVARGMLKDGTPIAVASLRSTYGSELGSAQGFFRLNNPDFMDGDVAAGRGGGFDSFRAAMGGGVQYTFNWFYIDDRDIGYQHSCKCPQRAQGVDPYLPVWGTGQWDWRSFIPLTAQPFDLNPAEGWIISWNNKQAPEFKANDRNFGLGPVYRSLMLQSRLQAAIAAGKVDRANIVDIMEDAGTVDLRGQEDLPLLLQVLGPKAPAGTDPRAQDMRDRLAAWLTTQTHRRDHDRSGEYDDPQAPAIMDAWWPRLSHAMFDASSGNAIDHLGLGLDDRDRIDHLGSAFGGGGFYSHVNKDLRQVLGQTVRDPWSRTYCGGGNLAACGNALWASLEQAAADLEREFGVPEGGPECLNALDEDGDGYINDGCPTGPDGFAEDDPANPCLGLSTADCRTAAACAAGNAVDDDGDTLINDGCSAIESSVANWKRGMDYEDVRHSPVGVTSVPAIHWINRPTFQQLVQIEGRPDLQVTSIVASNNKARQGEKVTITATVVNAGTTAAPGSKTEFLLDGVTGLGLVDTSAITAGGTATVSVQWDTRGVKGEHTISVTADKTGLVAETNETNNSATLTVTVRGNKVRNSSFEQANAGGSGPDAWSGSSTAAGTASWSEGGSDGSRSASVSGSGGSALLAGAPSWTSDPIEVTPGEVLNLAVSVRSTGASSPATAGLTYLGAAGEVLGTATLLTTPLITNGFVTLERTVTVPAGVTQARVVLAGFAASDPVTAGQVTFDEVGLFGN